MISKVEKKIKLPSGYLIIISKDALFILKDIHSFAEVQIMNIWVVIEVFKILCGS